MEPVSVLHLVPSLDLGQRDGVLLDLLARLDRRQFVVRVLSVVAPPEEQRHAFEAAGVRVTHQPLVFEGGHGLTGRIAQRARSVAALRDLLRTRQPRIVHTHEPRLNAYGGLAARLARVPHLMSHDWDPMRDSGRSRLLQRWTARRPDVAFVASRRLAENRRAVLGVGIAQVLQLPTEVDLQRFVPASPAQRVAARAALGVPPEACLIGTFEGLTAGALLIQALSMVAARAPHVYAVVRGEEDQRQELQARARAAGVEGRLFFQAPAASPLQLYHALDIVVSLAAGTTASCRTLAESLACGLPVVSRRDALHEDVARDHARFTEPRPRSLAEALIPLARSTADRQRLGSAARLHAARSLDIAVGARLLETVYARSVGVTPRARSRNELLTAR